MVNYSDFSSVEELMEHYHLSKPATIVEKKVELPDENGDDASKPTKVVNPDKLEVVYSDLKQDLKNIFKHIIIRREENVK